MKKILFTILLPVVSGFSYAQIDGTLLLGLTHATTSEMNAISNPVEGSIIYNTTDKTVYQFNGNQWETTNQLPADLADGDDDTTYSAGEGLQLSGTSMSVKQSEITPDWSNIKNIPSNLDTDNSNEIQKLTKTGTKISLSNEGGSISETETAMKQDTGNGKIYFINEAKTEYIANVVSEDNNNELKIGFDGGAYFELNSKTQTIEVDQSDLWAGQVNDTDIHSNGTLSVSQTRADSGWSFSGASTIKYTGTPDYVKIDVMAVANNTGNHWAQPHIKVFRNGTEIGEGSGLYMDDSATYSGRTTTTVNMIDPNPGTNPVYTFTTLEDDNRTMNNATISSLSPISLLAINKREVVVSISN